MINTTIKFVDNRYHNNDGPAIVTDVYTAWYQHGKLHRIDGPAYIDISGNYMWALNGKLHREDGPAYYYNDEESERIVEQWYYEGEYHRDGGPASTITCSNGRSEEKPEAVLKYYIHGILHCTTGPAYKSTIHTVEINGLIILYKYIWCHYGILHRENEPAVIIKYDNDVYYESWYQHGLPHRENGPSFSTTNGIEIWYTNGVLHRECGPAIINKNAVLNYYKGNKITPFEPEYVNNDRNREYF